MRADRGERPIEPAERRRHERPAGLVAGVGDGVARGEVVGPIGDHVVAGDQVDGVDRSDPHDVGDDPHVRVEMRHRIGGTLDFQTAEIRRSMDDLALKIRQRDRVVVDDTDRADPGRSEVLDQRRAEPPCPDDEHPRGPEAGLARTADLGQHEVAGVAFDFFRCEGHGLPIAVRGAARKRPHARTPPQ